ncbi:RNA polymerase sigma factor [Sphingobacterium sp. LRF_L2]|uniref:RNA polymerase sigma factor n=1 Tax=Sphingobacterium sp. LRF_L2 TaxID=3369421 RepID=UPI003F5ED0C2
MESKQLNLELIKSQGILRNIAIKFTKDPEEIEELVQETMVRSIKYVDKFFNNPKLIAWLYVIMKNTYINHYRRHQKQIQYENYQSTDYIQEGCSEPFTHNMVEGKFIMCDIEAAMQKLPKDYFDLFTRYLDGYKYQELSAYFSIPEGTIKTRIHHTRKFLQKQLAIYKKVDPSS